MIFSPTCISPSIINNLYLFTGENRQLLQEKLRFWQQEFIKKHSDSNLETFEDIKASDIPRILNAIESQPFLAEKRMVIIKDLPPSADSKSKLDLDVLETMIDNIPDTTVVIFVSPKPDKRTRFYKQLKSKASVELFDLLKGAELRGWIQQRLHSKGIRITAPAANQLILSCAEDMTRIAGELEKLELLNREELAEEDIERFVSPTPEAKIFKTLDLIGKAPRQEVMHSLDRLVSSGEDMMMIFFMIVRQFRLLLQMRSLLDRNTPKPVIQKRLKLAPFQVGMLSAQAQRFSSPHLQQLYRQLSEIDQHIKTGKIPLTGANTDLFHLKIDQFLCSAYE